MCYSLRKLPVCLKSIHLNQIIGNHVPRCMASFWSEVKMGPPDVILGISEAFKRDSDSKKVNLGVGAYRDDNGKPYVLPSVRMAEDIIHSKRYNHEYAPISGNADFCNAVARLLFGDTHPVITNKTNCTVQSLSGTGALRIGLEYINRFYPCSKVIYMPTPTWGNHPQLCNMLKIEHKKYRYFNKKDNGFDCQGAMEDISKIPDGSIILLHACAHNPTGVDPKPDHWKQMSDIIKKKNILPFFDMAYQGFATGNIENDAFAPRLFAQEGHNLILAQSFAKNMGLYGERCGALHILCEDSKIVAKVMSQVKIIIRVSYSNPPLYGSRIVTTVLNTPEIRCRWLKDVKGMADRIILMRQKLEAGLKKSGSSHNWQHVIDQIGMFCYTGLKPDQVARMTKEFHIYMTKDGRISVAGVTSRNVDYVAQCMHTVSK